MFKKMIRNKKIYNIYINFIVNIFINQLNTNTKNYFKKKYIINTFNFKLHL
jgi:hypothetical protein